MISVLGYLLHPREVMTEQVEFCMAGETGERDSLDRNFRGPSTRGTGLQD